MTPTNTEALAALMELADKFASCTAKTQLESLYGTSKSYTEQCLQFENKAREELSTELRRLLAERDALVADAERYRALRDDEAYPYAICIWDQEDGYAQDARKPEVIDAAIDAAMKGTQ